jgi:hypothetical protein
MGTLGGFPNPPALWLRRALPAFAYALTWEPARPFHAKRRAGLSLVLDSYP